MNISLWNSQVALHRGVILWDICEKKKNIWPDSLIPGIVLLKLLEFDGVFGMRANEVTPGFMLVVGGKYRQFQDRQGLPSEKPTE